MTKFNDEINEIQYLDKYISKNRENIILCQ